jgi:hypothetical protein
VREYLGVRSRDLTQDLPYNGLRVGRLWLDQGLALELQPSRPPADDGAVVRLLWEPFVFVDALGLTHRLVPHEHATLTPIFSLIGTHVTGAQVSRGGDLELAVDTGARLEAVRLEEGWEYEALPRFGGSVGGHS